MSNMKKMGSGEKVAVERLLWVSVVEKGADLGLKREKARRKRVRYKESELLKLDIQINGDTVEPLATIVHRDKAYAVGRALTQKLKELIPRQMFKVPIQACIGAKVIASESLSAIRKDVLSKCYGGDITRKKKLLKKQAEGKKRMKAIGKVDAPQEAFMAVLKLEKEVL